MRKLQSSLNSLHNIKTLRTMKIILKQFAIGFGVFIG